MVPKTHEDEFKVLGLPEGASTEDIKKAYYKLALKWHPDRWSDKSQEEQKTATEKFKEISVAYEILTGEIKEEFISKQHNDDWVDQLAEYFKNRAKELRKECYGSNLSGEEVDLFGALDNRDLAKTKALLGKVQNINVQTKPFNMWTGKSILHYIVENSCNYPESGWRELLEEVLSKYSANNSTPAHNSSVEPCSQLNIIDVNIWEDAGTPLHVACELGNLNVISMLLKYRADPNAHRNLKYTPLYYALRKSKNDVAKVLFEQGAKIDVGYVEEKLIISDITKYSQSTVETLLSHASDVQKSRILQCIVLSEDEETDHNIKIIKSLLEAGADPKFCDTETMFVNVSASYWAESKGKSKLINLFNEHKENAINNNLHCVQLPTTDNTKRNSPQKQSSGISPRVIGLALLFSAIGATLAAMTEIAAIGVIATAVLSGIVGALVGGVAGYLVDVAVNQCCGNTVNQQPVA
ncbi:DnaJ domain-containing protein [Wolbachia endosymbiont of Cantharis cryptica]|uniref:DnaJ domain-containing protein n=1 Tax=Wolbachia endosymbiont of Cantharis cryptica TaxID=3066132 RepID=UPI00376F0F10